MTMDRGLGVASALPGFEIIVKSSYVIRASILPTTLANGMVQMN